MGLECRLFKLIRNMLSQRRANSQNRDRIPRLVLGCG